MGSGVSKGSHDNLQVVVIGLDNSGKSTILTKLRDANSTMHAPVEATVGFKTVKLKVNSHNFTCYDMSGQGRYRSLWQHYYSTCRGLVFVIDSSDRMRLPVAREELELAVKSEDISQRKIPILILANKNDLANALPANKCASVLELDSLLTGPWLACSSNVLSGEGLVEGFSWLANQMRR